MSERPPRPRAFRLDDRRVAVDDQPASPCARKPIVRSQNDPIPGRPSRRRSTKRELEIEAAQQSGLMRPLGASTLARPRLDGARRPRLARRSGFGRRTSSRAFRAERNRSGSSGSRSASCSWSASSASPRARSPRSRARARIAEMHVALAKARAADDRAAARRAGRPARRALSQPAGDGARARAEIAGCDARDHRRARPHRHRRARAAAPARREGARRDRRRGQARLAGDGDQPARRSRRGFRRRADRAA